MSDKYKIISVDQFKQSLKDRLFDVASTLDNHDRMIVAINLKKALATIERYLDGDIKDLRRVELAEEILKESEAVAKAKRLSPAKLTA